MINGKTRFLFRMALCVGLGLTLPFLIQNKALATEIVILALFGIAYNILLGFTGLLSFGHAAFFGLGAYTSAICLKTLEMNIWESFGMAMIVAACFGVLIGLLCVRLQGLSFAFVTLAFAELVYFGCFQLRWLTGGDDGLSLIPVQEVDLPLLNWINMNNGIHRYYFIFGIGLIAITIIYFILASPLGKVLRAIRVNGDRASFLGYNVFSYRVIAVCLSGLFSGLAGALFSLHLNFVPIGTLHWTTSGHVVIITLIGGMKVFLGPAIGAAVVLMLESFVQQWFEQWELVVGMVFMLGVIFLPEGLSSVVPMARRLLGPKKSAEA